MPRSGVGARVAPRLGVRTRLHWPAPSRRSRRARPPDGANISSISSSAMIIGGQKAKPSPIARLMTPRFASSIAARGPTLPGSAKPAGDFSGASSSAPIRPSARPCRPAALREPVDMGPEAQRQRADAGRGVHPLVDLDGLHAHGAAHRMAAVGEAVAEGADPARMRLDRLGDVAVDRDGRQREIGGRHLLGRRHRGRIVQFGTRTTSSARSR